jgi:hypothetical protein
MRFKRSDMPGILIAAIAPVLLLWLFLNAFDVWHHHGTPLIGFMAGNFAIGGGLLAAFSRFVRRWDVPLGALGALLLLVLAVIWAQHSGNDGTALATALKLAAVADFLLLNLLIAIQVIENGLIPVLDRRDARRRAALEPAAE